MPSQALLIIGVKCPTEENVVWVCQHLGYNPTPNDLADLEGFAAKSISTSLRKLQLDFLEELTGADRAKLEGLVGAKGKPHMSEMYISLYGDSGEMDDEWPRDYIIGAAVVGRYAPVLLDWEDPTNPGQLNSVGGSYGGLHIDLELVARVVAAVGEILPGAKLYIKEEWF